MQGCNLQGGCAPQGGGGGGTGDVIGPASSTDGDLALFDGITGKLLQDGGVGLSTVENERIWSDPGTGTLAADLYVDNTTGSDTTGDGSAGNPWASLTKAILEIPILADNARKIHLAASATAYAFPSRTLWAFNLCTVSGELLNDGQGTLTSTAGTSGSEAAGTSVEVSGSAWTPDEHVGRLILWSSGVLSGKYGVVYANSADVLEVTNQNTTYAAPTSGDQFELLEHGSRIEWDPGTPATEETASVNRSLFFEDLKFNINVVGTDRSLQNSSISRVDYRRCFFDEDISCIVIGDGARARFRTCYFTNRGDDFAERGLIQAGKNGSLELFQGSVIDCRFATTTDPAGSGIKAKASSTPKWQGETVVRGMGTLGYSMEGCIAGINDSAGTTNLIRFIDCQAGIRINSNAGEGGGAYGLPDLYGNITGAYVVTASQNAYVTIQGGTASGTVGVLAVSADNGASNVAETSSGTLIEGGSPAAVGFTLGDTVYGGDGTIGAGRVATLTDTLELAGGRVLYNGAAETSTLNSTSVVEVKQASDLPATLAANTTYHIRGAITFSSPIAVTNAGCAIVGGDRNKDKLIWNGAAGTTAITVTDVDFELANLCLSSNNTGSVILDASNYLGGAFNNGRSKVLAIFDCQFRNCYDVATIEGFDLVDVSNTLFWYIEAPNHGLKFTSTSKIEISSCEFIRWFDETTIPTPSGFATCPMIELTGGMGAVNISGNIIHPQVTQDGIKVDPASTVGAGATISANTFVSANLGPGVLFSPDPATGGYSQPYVLKYDIAINQGLPDSNAYMLVTFVGNGTNTALSSGVPAVMNAGGNATATQSQRMTTTTDGVVTYTGTKEINVSLVATINFDKQGGGTDDYQFMFYKDTGSGFVQLTDSVSAIRTGGNNFVLPMSYFTSLSEGDQLAIYIENPGSNDDMRVTDLQWFIKE